ncbi:hypothetical protein BHM03_00036224, partial [Ensete ventricosum]
RAILAGVPSLPAGCQRFFSRARRWNVSPRGEKGRDDYTDTQYAGTYHGMVQRRAEEELERRKKNRNRKQRRGGGTGGEEGRGDREEDDKMAVAMERRGGSREKVEMMVAKEEEEITKGWGGRCWTEGRTIA